MIASFLGGIFGGGGKAEGAGGASDNTDNNAKLKDDIKALQKQFPDAKLSTLSDGTILCNRTKCKDIDEALDLLNKPDTPEIKDEGDKKLNNKGSDNGNEPLVKQEKTPMELSGFNNFLNLDIKKMDDDKTSAINLSATNDTVCSQTRGKNVNAPVTINVTKNGKTYVFELIDDKSKVKNGHPMYNCISNGRTLATNEIQEYLLNTSGDFYQTNDTKGYGIDLGKKVQT